MNWSNVVNVLMFKKQKSTVFKVVLILSRGNNAKGIFIVLFLIYRSRHSLNNCDVLSVQVMIKSCSITFSYIDSITASDRECASRPRFNQQFWTVNFFTFEMKSINFFHLWHFKLWLILLLSDSWRVLYNFVYNLQW